VHYRVKAFLSKLHLSKSFTTFHEYVAIYSNNTIVDAKPQPVMGYTKSIYLTAVPFWGLSTEIMHAHIFYHARLRRESYTYRRALNCTSRDFSRSTDESVPSQFFSRSVLFCCSLSLIFLFFREHFQEFSGNKSELRVSSALSYATARLIDYNRPRLFFRAPPLSLVRDAVHVKRHWQQAAFLDVLSSRLLTCALRYE
jgi:hypothetical protein